MISQSKKSPEKTRLCCITSNVQSGGAGKSLLVLAKELSKEMHVCLFSRSQNIPQKYLSKKVVHQKIGSGFFPLHYLSGARDPFLINYLAWLARCIFLGKTLSVINRESPDVVLINGFQGVWYLPFLSNKVKKIVYARELLDLNKSSSQLMLKLINKYADHIICITENERDNLPAMNCPISIVFNSYEEEWEVGESNSTLSEKIDSQIKVAVFGTIQQAKGQYLVLELLEKYRDTIDKLGIQFYLYGGKSTFTTRSGGQEELEVLVRRNNWEKYLKFPGWVDNVSAAMVSVDIVLRTDTSGCPWGRDIIEAMGNRKPVIAAGSSEVFINHGSTGMLFKPKDVDDLADKLFLLCGDKQLQASLSNNAYQFAMDNFDKKINASKVLKIIESLA